MTLTSSWLTVIIIYCISICYYRAIYESLWETVQPAQDKDKPIPQQPTVKTYKIADFQLLKVLGKGSFGKVRCLFRMIRVLFMEMHKSLQGSIHAIHRYMIKFVTMLSHYNCLKGFCDILWHLFILCPNLVSVKTSGKLSFTSNLLYSLCITEQYNVIKYSRKDVFDIYILIMSIHFRFEQDAC